MGMEGLGKWVWLWGSGCGHEEVSVGVRSWVCVLSEGTSADSGHPLSLSSKLGSKLGPVQVSSFQPVGHIPT